MTILVTVGAGFIGSNFALDWIASSDEPIVNLYKLTNAGNLENLKAIEADSLHHFVKYDIVNSKLVGQLLNEHDVRAVINFAA